MPQEPRKNLFHRLLNAGQWALENLVGPLSRHETAEEERYLDRLMAQETKSTTALVKAFRKLQGIKHVHFVSHTILPEELVGKLRDVLRHRLMRNRNTMKTAMITSIPPMVEFVGVHLPGLNEVATGTASMGAWTSANRSAQYLEAVHDVAQSVVEHADHFRELGIDLGDFTHVSVAKNGDVVLIRQEKRRKKSVGRMAPQTYRAPLLTARIQNG